jgi:primosomal replication protein N
LVASLLLHCASVLQATQEFVASLQIGVLPLHCVSELHAKQLPDGSQIACAGFFALHWALLAHATQL